MRAGFAVRASRDRRDIWSADRYDKIFRHMTSIHFIGGEKGGVGKSVVARILAQYFIDQEIAVSRLRYRPVARVTAPLLRGLCRRRPSWTDIEGLDRIVEAAVEHPERRIIVDLAAQTHRFLALWMEDPGCSTSATNSGLSLSYWHVMDAGRDSADLLVTCSISSAVVCRSSSCSTRSAAATRDRRVVRRVGAREGAGRIEVIALRRLQESTMQKIDAQNTSFWAAIHRRARTVDARSARAAAGQALVAPGLRRAGPHRTLTCRPA